jgi:hypothetical protein
MRRAEPGAPLGAWGASISRRSRVGVVGLALASTLLASCGQSEDDGAVALPPPDASHRVVLETYLRALVAGDCETAHALAAESFTFGNGELCGAVEVSDFEPLDGPATPSEREVTYSTVLTTDGSTDGSIQPGKQTWFYSLQPINGGWRLVGGGSGP